MTPRLSVFALFVLAPFVAPSCLVTAKQDFPAPPQTPPFLSAANASPALSEVVQLPYGKKQTFRTTVRSEDDGVRVEAHLALGHLSDIDPVSGRPFFPIILKYAFVAPSTFDDTSREVAITFDPTDPTQKQLAGCYRVTLIVSHSFVSIQSNKVLSPDDQDFIVWWVAVGDSKDPTLVPPCPQ